MRKLAVALSFLLLFVASLRVGTSRG